MAENKNSGDEICVATRTAHVDFEGRRTLIRKGTTRVRADHDLVKAYPDLFEAASTKLTFDVEDTLARPGIVTRGTDGHRRGVRVGRSEAKATPGSEPKAEPYKGVGKKELEAEVEKRNAQYGDDAKIVVGGKGNVADLKAALVKDDERIAAQHQVEPAPPVDEGGEPHKENQTDTTSPVKNDPDKGDGAGDS